MTAPAKTPEVFEYLEKCAAQMRTVSYRDVGTSALRRARVAGRPVRRPHA